MDAETKAEALAKIGNETIREIHVYQNIGQKKKKQFRHYDMTPTPIEIVFIDRLNGFFHKHDCDEYDSEQLDDILAGYDDTVNRIGSAILEGMSEHAIRSWSYYGSFPLALKKAFSDRATMQAIDGAVKRSKQLEDDYNKVAYGAFFKAKDVKKGKWARLINFVAARVLATPVYYAMIADPCWRNSNKGLVHCAFGWKWPSGKITFSHCKKFDTEEEITTPWSLRESVRLE